MVVRDTNAPESIVFGLGLFRIAAYNNKNEKYGCLPYLKDEKHALASDGPFIAGRFFGIMTVVASTVAFVTSLMVMLFCTLISGKLWRVLQGVHILSLFMQLFTFSVFAAGICDDFSGLQATCDAGTSSVLAIVNVILILVLLLLSCAVPPPPTPVFQRWDSTDDRGSDSRDDNNHENRKVVDENIAVPANVEKDDNQGNYDAFYRNEKGVFPRRNSTDDRRSGTRDGNNPENRTVVDENIIVPANVEKNEIQGNYDDDSSSSSEITNPCNDEGGGSLVASVDDYAEELGDGDTCKITREIIADGTKIIKEVTHADGSKTITTTIEALVSEVDDDDYEV